MGNPFTSSGGNLSGFARDVIPVTPNDGADLQVGIVRVWATGTTATGIVAFVV